MRSILLLFLVTSLFYSCNESVDDNQKSKVKATKTKNRVSHPKYTVLKGQKLFDADYFRIMATNRQNNLELSIFVSLPDSVESPSIPGLSNARERADNIIYSITATAPSNPEFNYTTSIEQLMASRKGELFIKLTPKDLKELKPGMVDLKFDIDGEFTTLFEVKSGIHPIQFTISVPIEISPIYETAIEFKSLSLDKKATQAYLGPDNDMHDPRPEVQVIIRYNYDDVINEMNKNSYTLNRPTKAFIYHNSPKDSIDIFLNDMDYGFNKNDILSQTKLPIRELLDKKDKDISFGMASSLFIHCDSTRLYNK